MYARSLINYELTPKYLFLMIDLSRKQVLIIIISDKERFRF